MDKYIEAFVKFLNIEKSDDNLYKIDDSYYYIGTKAELETLAIREKLHRDERVACAEDGSTDLGYNDWVNDLKNDLVGLLNEIDGETSETFVINGEELIVIRGY